MDNNGENQSATIFFLKEMAPTGTGFDTEMSGCAVGAILQESYQHTVVIWLSARASNTLQQPYNTLWF